HPDPAWIRDAVARKLAQRPARPVHAADLAESHSQSPIASRRADRSTPRAGRSESIPRTQFAFGARDARRSPGGRPGHSALESPRFLYARPLSGVRPRRVLPSL